MENDRRHYGFSLTETLMAVATLAVGLLFIGGTFMTGVYFSTVSTERTIASVAAGEAFAKIRLYGEPNGLSTSRFMPYEQVKTASNTVVTVDVNEYLYPSTGETSAGQYSWSAICRRTRSSSSLVEFTVFVCRKSNPASKYWVRQTGAGAPALAQSDLPRPVYITISQDLALMGEDEVTIVDAVPTDGIDEHTFVFDGASIVDDVTGQIYRVLERSATQPDRVRLDRRLNVGANLRNVWVVPPPTSGGRNPLIAVYQKVLRFTDAQSLYIN